MDLLKTHSIQSLMDSDLESVESFPYLDIEELDEVEYALPISEAPTLAEVLLEEDDGVEEKPFRKVTEEPPTCSALQVDFLQAISQQLTQAQERSSAGAATTLVVGKEGRLTVGTAHGHLLSFQDQTLRWVCDSNSDRGAVSCLAYNNDGTRLLAGYARGLICQYESIKGLVLRRVMLGCDIWGTLRVTWAGTSGLALDTGGSVWLIKFSRPLGVRSARSSCLFSGARGEVVAMTARDSRVLALATLSRVIVVAGGHAAGVRLAGPPNTLPVLEWCESGDRMLVSARAKLLQWLSVTITGTSINLRPVKRLELKTTPMWLGWLGGSLAVFDVDENLRVCGDDYDKPLDLSHVEPVYASAFFKGVWTDGRVSAAMCSAGASALGGICVTDGSLSLLGRRGVVRIRPRDLVARAQAFITSGRYLQALRLLCSNTEPDARALVNKFITVLAERPHILADKNVADQTIKLCLKYKLSDELWSTLWENCSSEKSFVEALGDAAVRGEFSDFPPSPDSTQALIEKLSDCEPGLVERVVASLPLTSLDPHRASVFTREKKLWRGVGAIAAALGGSSGAMRELMPYVDESCAAHRSNGSQCACAGGALLLAAADALAGRGAAGRPLPQHQQPSARHDALHTLLVPHPAGSDRSPLRALVVHEAGAAARLLEQSARHPPFAGPLAKQNRLRVARALLAITHCLEDPNDRIEIIDFLSGQLNTGALPLDPDVIKQTQELASLTVGERSDRAWLSMISRIRNSTENLNISKDLAKDRPRVLWRINTMLNQHKEAIEEFFKIESPSSADTDELFEFLRSRIDSNDEEIKLILEPYLEKLVELKPRATAAIASNYYTDTHVHKLLSATNNHTVEFGEYLLEVGKLKGDSAADHLRNLCALRPSEVTTFLSKNVGIVRPEDALEIVKKAGIAEAEPMCLEATGDIEGALDAILQLASAASERGDTELSTRLSEEACSVCARGASCASPAQAARLWLRCARAAPPALLLDAAAYLPLDELIEKTCDSPRVALTLLDCAANQRRMWECAARLTGQEAHEALAISLREASRGLAVRGNCTNCGRPLSTQNAVRTLHCGRAVHAECSAELSCGVCGARLPPAATPLPRPAFRVTSLPPNAHALVLVAPPRPDLEGVV